MKYYLSSENAFKDQNQSIHFELSEDEMSVGEKIPLEWLFTTSTEADSTKGENLVYVLRLLCCHKMSVLPCLDNSDN